MEENRNRRGNEKGSQEAISIGGRKKVSTKFIPVYAVGRNRKSEDGGSRGPPSPGKKENSGEKTTPA